MSGYARDGLEGTEEFSKESSTAVDTTKFEFLALLGSISGATILPAESPAAVPFALAPASPEWWAGNSIAILFWRARSSLT
jgi:hypothetical protein